MELSEKDREMMSWLYHELKRDFVKDGVKCNWHKCWEHIYYRIIDKSWW